MSIGNIEVRAPAAGKVDLPFGLMLPVASSKVDGGGKQEYDFIYPRVLASKSSREDAMHNVTPYDE